MQQTISIIVSGKVQGVFFRQKACEIAKQFSITGTVQNLANGNVKIIATANAVQLQQLIEWCHIGPARANVEKVEVAEISPKNSEDFRILRV